MNLNYLNLPVISKICERHVHVTFLSWLQEFRLLAENQSAYMKNHSCVTALIDITDTLLLTMDKGDIKGLLMLDLSKAIDLINHDLLLKKLEIYGLGETTLGWFSLYLRMRKQAVAVNGTISDFLDISRGVPQGSILGPLLFITFMNELSFEINDPQKLKRVGKGGCRARFTGTKSKIHSSRELKRTFHELRTIQRLL